MKKFLEIRNIGIKTILMILGLILVVASVYNSAMFAFLITDKKPEQEIYWSLLSVGFFLAVGAAFYNKALGILVKWASKLTGNKTQ